jgi:hypothetical protein
MRINAVSAIRVSCALASAAFCACAGEYEDPPETETSAEAVFGGHILTAAEELRSGVVAIRIPTLSATGRCSAAVLRTSSFRNETFLLTAAHCFKDYDTSELIEVGGDFNFTVEFGETSEWWPHPNYEDASIGRSSRDLAVIRLPTSIPINSPSDVPVRNWYRPVFDHNPRDSDSGNSTIRIFGTGGQQESPFSVDSTVRYFVGHDYTDVGDGNIEIDDEDPTSDAIGGDSGGPWITAFGTMHTTPDLLKDGVIIGTSSAKCCAPGSADLFAAATFASSNLAFIEERASDSVIISHGVSWEREEFTDWWHLRVNEKAALIQTVVLSL